MIENRHENSLQAILPRAGNIGDILRANQDELNEDAQEYCNKFMEIVKSFGKEYIKAVNDILTYSRMLASLGDEEDFCFHDQTSISGKVASDFAYRIRDDMQGLYESGKYFVQDPEETGDLETHISITAKGSLKDSSLLTSINHIYSPSDGEKEFESIPFDDYISSNMDLVHNDFPEAFFELMIALNEQTPEGQNMPAYRMLINSLKQVRDQMNERISHLETYN